MRTRMYGGVRGRKTKVGGKPTFVFLLLDLSAVRAGFEPAVQLPVRQFSKLVVSATHPSHQWSHN